MTKNNINQDMNRVYYDSIMPGMTVQQAIYIREQPYGSFPHSVYSKATAILQGMQERFNQLSQERSKK
jgi:hypothetical protein